MMLFNKSKEVFCQMPVISLYFARNENKCRIKIPIAELCRVMPSKNADCRVLCRVQNSRAISRGEIEGS